MSSPPTLRLRALQASDAPALLDFELSNRAFFEAHINARPSSFYSEAGVRAAIESQLAQAACDAAYAFLGFDADGQLAARVNLTRVRRAHFHSAELGYRVAQAQGGRGIGSAAVAWVLQQAFGPLSLRRVEAAAHAQNTASLRLLARQGFKPFGRSTRSFELAGQWLDTLHLECHAPA